MGKKIVHDLRYPFISVALLKSWLIVARRVESASSFRSFDLFFPFDSIHSFSWVEIKRVKIKTRRKCVTWSLDHFGKSSKFVKLLLGRTQRARLAKLIILRVSHSNWIAAEYFLVKSESSQRTLARWNNVINENMNGNMINMDIHHARWIWKDRAYA